MTKTRLFSLRSGEIVQQAGLLALHMVNLFDHWHPILTPKFTRTDPYLQSQDLVWALLGMAPISKPNETNKEKDRLETSTTAAGPPANVFLSHSGPGF